MNSKISSYYQSFLQAYEKRYNTLLDKLNEKKISDILRKYLFYTPNLKGKLLRSLLAYRSCEIFGVHQIIKENIAVATEIFQSFTLIHDDLPALDNDDIRRGKPALHKIVGEANAILIGDALSLLTFMILTENLDLPEVKKSLNGIIKFINSLSSSSIFSLIDGQIEDLDSNLIKDSKQNYTQENLIKMYEKKTGSFFALSLSSGPLVSELQKQTKDLHEAGILFGKAFQLADDIEDYTIEKNKKTTSFAVIFGLEKTKKYLKDYFEKSTQIIKNYDKEILLLLFEDFYSQWSEKYGIN